MAFAYLPSQQKLSCMKPWTTNNAEISDNFLYIRHTFSIHFLYIFLTRSFPYLSWTFFQSKTTLQLNPHHIDAMTFYDFSVFSPHIREAVQSQLPDVSCNCPRMEVLSWRTPYGKSQRPQNTGPPLPNVHLQTKKKQSSMKGKQNQLATPKKDSLTLWQNGWIPAWHRSPTRTEQSLADSIWHGGRLQQVCAGRVVGDVMWTLNLAEQLPHVLYKMNKSLFCW